MTGSRLALSRLSVGRRIGSLFEPTAQRTSPKHVRADECVGAHVRFQAGAERPLLAKADLCHDRS